VEPCTGGVCNLTLPFCAGLRLIGYARSVTHTSEDVANQARGDPSSSTAMEGTTFLGFMAFQDPVREGVAEAVEKCHKAGVRVIMVTGDHLKTGLAVASASGILDSQGLEGREDVAGVSCADSLLQCMAEEEVQKLVSETSVFARATPNDKLIILETLQGSGKCVMATGDGMLPITILAVNSTYLSLTISWEHIFFHEIELCEAKVT
jgi:Ca2+-transporting ATPase